MKARCVAILALAALLALAPLLSAAEPLRIHMLGCGEYSPVESLTAFKKYLEERYRVEITTSFSLHASAINKGTKQLPNFESLKTADVLVLFARRLNLPEEQMAIIRGHWEAGKPIVAMRTSSHAFQPADNEVFDQQVLGGSYTGAGSYTAPFKAIPTAEQAEHPILKGVEPITSRGYYNNKPLAKDAVVLQIVDEPERKTKRPVTWVHAYKGGRMFYTSMGVPEDFQLESFRQLLTNAIHWTAQREAEPVKK